MPAVSSDLKDLMCYQLNKFERTTVVPLLDEDLEESSTLNQDYSKRNSTESIENVLYQNLPLHCHVNNYQNIDCDCDTIPSFTSSGTGKDKLTYHHSFHVCPEYESRVKRSRTIRFGSGGDVIIDKNHGYANTSWLVPTSSELGSTSSPPPPLCEKIEGGRGVVVPLSSSDGLMSRRNSHSQLNRSSSSPPMSNGITNNNLTISLNLPTPFDLDSFLRTHSLSISINVSEKKSSLDRAVVDAFNRQLLNRSGWYYQNIDWQESKRILKSSPIGTFLLRDSSDPRYSFSLSVQTTKGPISSRICYKNGKYRLDSQTTDIGRMPAFLTINALIDYYTKNGLVKSTTGRQVWIDSLGQVCSPVQLTKPKLKETGSLKHLCRLMLNKNPSLVSSPQLPNPIKSYLEEYPYTL